MDNSCKWSRFDWLVVYLINCYDCYFSVLFPLIVAHDHLTIPRGSSPDVVTLGCNVECKMVWVPTGLYSDDHGMC